MEVCLVNCFCSLSESLHLHFTLRLSLTHGSVKFSSESDLCDEASLHGRNTLVLYCCWRSIGWSYLTRDSISESSLR